MNESNYDVKVKDSVFNNDTTFSQKRFGELIAKVDNLEAMLLSGGSSCNCDNWEWNPEPIYETTLTNGFVYDDEDGRPYELPSTVFSDNPKALLVSFQTSYNPTTGIAVFNGITRIRISFNNNINDSIIINNTTATANNNSRFGFDCLIIPYHGLYIIHGIPVVGEFSAYSYKGNPVYSKICYESFNSTAIKKFSVFDTMPANTKIAVFTNI